MKIKNTYEYQFPSYALCALFNGDFDGLEDEDIKHIEKFMEDNKHIDVFDQTDTEDNESYFCKYPEFGLACDVVDLIGIEFEKEEN